MRYFCNKPVVYSRDILKSYEYFKIHYKQKINKCKETKTIPELLERSLKYFKVDKNDIDAVNRFAEKFINDFTRTMCNMMLEHNYILMFPNRALVYFFIAERSDRSIKYEYDYINRRGNIAMYAVHLGLLKRTPLDMKKYYVINKYIEQHLEKYGKNVRKFLPARDFYAFIKKHKNKYTYVLNDIKTLNASRFIEGGNWNHIHTKMFYKYGIPKEEVIRLQNENLARIEKEKQEKENNNSQHNSTEIKENNNDSK